MNATAPPTLKGKARVPEARARALDGHLVESCGRGAVLGLYAGDHGRVLIRLSRPAAPEYFVVEHAPKAHGARRLEAAAPREFSVTGYAADGSTDVRPGRLLLRRRRAGGPALPAKFSRGGRGRRSPRSRCPSRATRARRRRLLSLPGALITG